MSTTVSGSWAESLDYLQLFIQSNPRLEVEANSLCIPEDLRLEFSKLFDTVRLRFIESECQALVEHSHILSASYTDLETQLTQRLGLDSIVLPADLEGFLHNPVKALAGLVRNPLFDCIKDKIDRDSFQQQVSDKIQKSYRTLYYSGYIRWVMLSLALMAMPKQLFKVSINLLMDQDAVFHDINEERLVPDPVLTKRLTIADEAFVTFLVPDFIIDSQSATRFISFKAQAGKPISPAKQSSDEREWLSTNTQLDLQSSLLAYIDTSIKNLALVADLKRFCRPDLLILFRDVGQVSSSDMSQTTKLNDILKPVRGSYILLLNSLPISQRTSPERLAQMEGYAEKSKQCNPDQTDEIQTLDVGFNRTLLETVFNRLFYDLEKEV